MATTVQYGDLKVVYLKHETVGSYGVPPAIAGSNAIKVRSALLADADRQRLDPEDHMGTFSVLERVEGSSQARWSLTCLLRPSGTAATPAMIGPLLKLAMGTETIAANVAYTQLLDRSDLHATIYQTLNDVQQWVTGAVCEQVRIAWSGRDFVTLEFSGPAKQYGQLGPDGTPTAGTTTNLLAVSNVLQFAPYGRIAIGAASNAGKGYLISAVNYFNNTTGRLTLGSTASWSANAAITGQLPTPTYTGDQVIFGTKVCTSVDGGSTTQRATGGEIMINTGQGVLNEEECTSSPSESISTGKWSVTGNMALIVRKDDVKLYTAAQRHLQKSCKWTFGDTAGYIMEVEAEQVEFDPSEMDIPGSGLVRLTMPFEALGNTGEDNVKITTK